MLRENTIHYWRGILDGAAVMGLEGNECQLVQGQFCQQVVHGDIAYNSDLLNPLPDLFAKIKGIHCLDDGSQGQAVEPIFVLVIGGVKPS